MFFDEAPIEIIRTTPSADLWRFFPIGYLVTILIETPVLLLALPRKLTFKQKLLCGIWLTACTYPVVVLVLPPLLQPVSSLLYLIVAESFAHFGECVIFWLAMRGRVDFDSSDWLRAFIAIFGANFLSFSLGEVLNYYRWFGLF